MVNDAALPVGGHPTVRARHETCRGRKTGANAEEGQFFGTSNQCLNNLTPVNTIAISYSSAAAITSASRTEPPG